MSWRARPAAGSKARRSPLRAARPACYSSIATAAPFGDFDDLHLLGLVEGEWPARLRRNVFFGQGILKTFGWPDDAARSAAERASFVDLMRSPRAHVSLSGFSLEEDSLVGPSSLLDEAPRAGLSALTLRVPGDRGLRARGAGGAGPFRWMPSRSPRHRGVAMCVTARIQSAGVPRLHAPARSACLVGQCARPLRPVSVQALLTLRPSRLGEEREEEDGLTPLERGRLIHEVFETFLP